jgi:hypothetical protein
MDGTPNQGGKGSRAPAVAVGLALLLLMGCNAPRQPVYEDGQGFRFVPPPGWVERARGEEIPARAARGKQDLPLPPLGGSGKQQERLLVRYDRISTAHHAWLRVTVVDLPSTTPLKAYLSTRLPGQGWKRESEGEGLEVSGLPAARVAFVGRWYDQDYLCETVAVRKGEKVYLFAAAFPASEGTAREQVRQAVAAATWQ